MQIIQTVIFYITTLFWAVAPVQSYTEGVVGQPRSFFPHQIKTQNDQTISKLIYRSLFRYDIYGDVVPDLAESWAVSDEGLVYTIKIKKDQRWADNTIITADDLIYTSFKVAELRDVATDKVDDYTVRFTLPNKFSPFLSLLTVGIMQSNSDENYDPLIPVSSGQFRVIRIKRAGPAVKEVILLNQQPNANFKKLIFRYYSDEKELALGAKLGEVDGFMHSQDLTLEKFENKKFPQQGVYYSLIFNLQEDKFKDLEFRKKLESTLDKEAITYPYGILVEGPISRSVFTDPKIDFDTFNEDFIPEDINDVVTITIPDLPHHINLARAIEETWENKLGLSVEIHRVEPQKMLNQVIRDRKFEILLYGQEVGRDPDRYVNWHSTQKDYPGLNLAGFEQVRVDRALEEGRNQTDFDERQIHYKVFQEALVAQVPAIFLYHPFVNYYVSKYISGIGDKYTFTVGDRFLDINNWSRIKTN